MVVQVRDKVLLAKLATVLQQMDGSVFSSPEAVQEVSVILNAYAGSQMNEVALVLSQTLTNHLKPYIGGVTAQVIHHPEHEERKSRADMRYAESSKILIMSM